MDILVIGLNHRTAPVELREKLALTAKEQSDALAHLKLRTREAALLSTCNRVELYLVAEQAADARRAAREFLSSRFHAPTLPSILCEFSALRSIEHLFAVASGLDSMVVGETEIFGQVKEAYQRAVEAGTTGAVLHRLFQKAFQVAKHIRTHTAIGAGNVSVGSVAVDLAEKIFGNLARHRVMILGAGQMSEATARALLQRGVPSLIVSNRTFERAEKLAAELQGRAVRFDDWEQEFSAVDIIISSTAAPHAILTRDKLAPLMANRHHRPLFLIDIAVPRDIEPSCNDLDGVFLYNIDDLQSIAQQNLAARQKEIQRCEGIIRAQAARLYEKIFGAPAPDVLPQPTPRTMP